MTTTPERDELAVAISNHLDASNGIEPTEPAGLDIQLADALLAAGYRCPRTISTVAELDALAENSVLVAANKNVLTKARDGHDALHWWNAGDSESWRASEIRLPATVLHDGGAA